jgi:hypothetical protein
VVAWLAVILAVCLRSGLRPRERTLYTTWSQAGRDWMNGRDLYRSYWEYHQDQFRYSPLVAVTLVPFGPLPEGLGGILWRLLNAATLLGGLLWWMRAGLPRPASAREQAAALLLILPLSLSSLNNAQPNPLLIGLLLMTATAAATGRWNLAAVCVVLATAWKVYPLAVGLLLAAAYPRRFAPRLLLALAAWLALPLVCQHWDYVTHQYALWWKKLGTDDRKGWPPHMAYRDLWQLLRVWHVPLTPGGYLLIQAATAAGSALLCVAARLRGWGAAQVAQAALALGCCWMTLLGPATEAATYVLIAPVLAWAALEAIQRPWQRWGFRDAPAPPWPAPVRWMPAVSWWLFLLAVLAGLLPGTTEAAQVGRHPLAVLAEAVRSGRWPPTNQIHALGLHALAALLLTAACAVAMLRSLAGTRPGRAAAQTPPPARAA